MQDWAAEEGVDQEAIRERLIEAADAFMAEKEAAFGPDTMRNIEKQVLLQTIDAKWREHLLRLEHLRSVVGFRGYAQRDPLNEYKTESFQLFENLLDCAARGGHAEARRAPAHDGRGKPGDDAEPPAAPSAGRPGAPSQHRPRASARRRRRPRPRPRPATVAAALAPVGAATTELAPGTPREGFDDKTRRPGGTRRATTPAPAARARSSSTATGPSERP